MEHAREGVPTAGESSAEIGEKKKIEKKIYLVATNVAQQLNNWSESLLKGYNRLIGSNGRSSRRPSVTTLIKKWQQV